ncbi:hypothetical protein J1D01_00430 [Seonamhaeicola sp. NFXS20]|uniref:hypothetical protein n=1 Tax=Seonamhaeicola sp. NFXS20 TaxID=2816959 RepID=UPI003B8E5151
MNKILYFDNWDKGYRNFLRLDLGFKEKGFETLLLHTSSLIFDDVEKEKEIDGLKLKDISFYKTKRIKKVFKYEKPDIVIILNLSFLIDRAIVKICKDLNIKIFHLSHGKLIPKDSISVVKSIVEKENKFGLLSKISKKNVFAAFNYFSEYPNPIHFFKFINKAIKNPMEYTLFPRFSDELEVNKSLVYYPSDYEIMINEFGFPEHMVEVVGNPELDNFFHAKILDRDFFLKNHLNIESNKYVAYFDDGLALIYGWDTSKWLSFLEDLNEVLIKENLKLIVKLHPRRDITDCVSFFEANNIKYFYDIDFKNLINHSLFVISHFSSVIIYALLLNKIVKSPRWGLSEGLEEKYPEGIVTYYYNKLDFEQKLLNVDVNEESIKNYLFDSIGKVDGNAIPKIINIITSND